MRNVPWTPAFEFASSLQGRLDHAIVEPRAPKVTVTPDAALCVYAAGQTQRSAPRCFLVPVKADGSAEKPLGAANRRQPRRPLHHQRRHSRRRHRQFTRFRSALTADGRPAPPPPQRSAFTKNLPLHIESLSENMQRPARPASPRRQKKDGPRHCGVRP